MDNVIRNRQVNYKRVITPKAVEEGEERLNNLKEAIERARVIVDNLKGNAGWEAVKKTYAEKIQSIDVELEKFKDLPDKHTLYLLADKKFSTEFRDTVERMESQIEFLTETFNDSKTKIDEQKQRLRQTEPNKF